jgi:hypothetical protein
MSEKLRNPSLMQYIKSGKVKVYVLRQGKYPGYSYTTLASVDKVWNL